MNLINYLGLAAAILGMVTFMPQVVQCVRTRNTRGISLLTYLIIVVNTVLWSWYGLLRHDFAIILVNVFIFFTAGTIVVYKLKYG